MNKTQPILTFLCIVLLSNIALTQAIDSTGPPNVILIVVDDMGWKDVGYHGSEVRTPTMDPVSYTHLTLPTKA